MVCTPAATYHGEWSNSVPQSQGGPVTPLSQTLLPEHLEHITANISDSEKHKWHTSCKG